MVSCHPPSLGLHLGNVLLSSDRCCCGSNGPPHCARVQTGRQREARKLRLYLSILAQQWIRAYPNALHRASAPSRTRRIAYLSAVGSVACRGSIRLDLGLLRSV